MSTPLTKLLAALSLVGIAAVLWLGLVVSPADVDQGELVRLIYIHPATAWIAYLAFITAAVASALYLYPRTRSRFWDLLAGASAEIGVVFCGLALVTGAIWGRPTWGVWWTWDARLTTTALLFALFIGYLAVRRIAADEHTVARRSAIVALIAVLDIPIVHMSVEWWRTLHQQRTLLDPSPSIEGIQLATMLLSVVVMSCVFAWMLVHRFRIERLKAEVGSREISRAIEERRAESETTTTGDSNG
jgi:heme exporter protein C